MDIEAKIRRLLEEMPYPGRYGEINCHGVTLFTYGLIHTLGDANRQQFYAKIPKTITSETIKTHDLVLFFGDDLNHSGIVVDPKGPMIFSMHNNNGCDISSQKDIQSRFPSYERAVYKRLNRKY